jgi:hypothetical protein
MSTDIEKSELLLADEKMTHEVGLADTMKMLGYRNFIVECE